MSDAGICPKKKMSEKATRLGLAATIRSIAQVPGSSSDRKVSAEFVIAALRDRGQDAGADELERMVLRIRAQRAAEL